MKERMVLSLLVIFLTIFITLVIADFNVSITPATTDAGLTQIFNFTINATSGNVTQLNITIPSGFSFVNGSNGTSTVNWTFSNTTNILRWLNTTPEGFVNNTIGYFWFNASISKTIYDTKNFNISVLNTSNNIVSYNVSVSILRTVWSSPNETFYIKPTSILLNWTNAYQSNITIVANSTNVTIKILNDTTPYPDSGATPNYSQGYPTAVCQRIPLAVRNSTGEYNNTEIERLNISSNRNSTNVTLIHIHSECYPGRYLTDKLTIKDLNSSSTANITVYIDVPISTNNTLSSVTGIGNFSGTLPANASTYHLYYFNTSGIENVNSVYVNISWSSSSQDIDLFLLDNSSNLLAKSINKSSTRESLSYNFLPSSPTMYEIRLYGNSTSSIAYNGNVIFSTLNSTNRTLNFGVGNVSTTFNQIFILNNTGNINLSSVVESKDLYHVIRFRSNESINFTFLVPDSTVTSKLKVSLNWTGASNYSFYLYNSSENLVANSINKHYYANVSNVMQEEYVETTDITKGTWKVEIRNSTNITVNDPYNLTVYQYVANASKWITTNYSSTTFIGDSSQNYRGNATVNLNLTIQNESMNGTYEGYIRYTSSSNQLIDIPITVSVTTPMLVVNKTINSAVFTIDENYGANLTRILYFNITNPGYYDLVVNFTDSGNLSCYSGSCSGYNGSLAYNSTTLIPANSFKIINVNMTFNSSMPKNTVYSGWININGTNITNAKLTAHPYSGFTINLRLNLTDLLDVRIVDFRSSGWNDKIIGNASINENVTLKLDIYYINGTGPITDLYGLSNFTSVWLQEGNVTSIDGRIPSTGNLSYYSGVSGGPWCGSSCPPWGGDSHYYVNATILANKPGGLYNINVIANYSRGSFTFGGVGTNGSLVVNNTGLYMYTPNSSSNSVSISLSNSSTYVFAVNVSNYGPVAASSVTINFTKPSSCSGYTVAYTGLTGACSGSGSGVTFTISPVAYNTSCLVWWTITAGTSATTECTSNIIGSPIDKWFNPSGINVSVTVTNTTTSGTTTTTTTSGTTTTTTTTTTTNLEFTKAETLVFVQQNSTNTTEVEVKNTGNTTQNVTFSIIDFDQSWFTLNATTANLLSGKTAGFKITFSIGDAAVKDYTGQYYAIGTNKLTKNFTLRVLPAPAKQTEINDTLALYKADAVNLEVEINESRAKGVNVTLAEQKLADLKSKIEQAENYIKAGDYFSAYQLFTDIKTLMDDTKSELAKAKAVVEAGKKRFRWIIIGVGAAVIGIGVLAYMFWPTKPGYHQEKGFTPKKEENLWDNLKEKWEKIKKGK